MRLDKGMDQLVKKVVEKDMAFSAVIGEAQMLVFPSTLLPKKNQTFHGKHYLWGVFRRGGEYKKAAAIAAEQQPQHGSDDQRCKPQEQENTKEDASNEQQQRKEPNSNLQKTPALMKHAMRPVKEEQLPLSSAMDTHSSVVDEQCTAASVRERTDQRRPAEAGRGDAVPANHGRVIGLVVRQTPWVEELIQQMRRGGALVATMAGEMMGSGFGPN
ncbi:hypothetical protein E2562_024494 [Oryza meyeriana var. granulata]|uniref:AIPP2-like SPOC-like domain-containing protein n=1 Tax=Oryza meyeriana var. granulata TaxID=110450 RepID=A0A6G1BN34_9ORYZ|nr:hypothetical protein E2562_024494 [Oryza meyeriana var. granulata]